MREIKFRGKDCWGNWRYGDLMKNSIPTASPVIVEDFYYDDPDDSMFEVDPATVGQFTGRKDVNKKDIFEDDVVFFLDSRAHERIGVIKWHEKAYCWVIDCGEAGRDMLAYYACEIKGNVHDNPDLLKEMK